MAASTNSEILKLISYASKPRRPRQGESIFCVCFKNVKWEGILRLLNFKYKQRPVFVDECLLNAG